MKHVGGNGQAWRFFKRGGQPTLTDSVLRAQHGRLAMTFGNSMPIRHYVRPNYFQDRPSLKTRRGWGNLMGGNNPFGNNVISRWLRFDTANKVVYTILGINTTVFLAWLYAKENAARFGDRRLYVWMMKNFTNMERNVREGRVWSLLTCAFSHQRIEHFALNSIALVSFGQACWNMLGTRQFMLLYLGSALASSVLSIGYHKYIVRDSYRQYSLGASGALTGLATTFACVYPRAQFMLFFVVPVPAGLLIGAFGLYEAYNLLNKNTGIFDSAGHLGGGLFGAAYYMHKVLPILRRTGRW
ncbi:hypothetical protein BGW42_008564 [Actinomortierella wolfii]|nr:hypothetical protein BGW42_008564 [Actinomortierella wolfii]